MSSPDERENTVGRDLLPTVDTDWLDKRGFRWEAALDGGMINVIIRDYTLPPGYDHDRSDLLVRLPGSWPDGTPDMFWLLPHVRIHASGAWPDRAAKFVSIAGQTWQRWSRHIQGGWRSGEDRLSNFLAIVDRALVEAVT
jgi:hypothetical protein